MHFLYFYTLPRLLETLLKNGTGHIRAQNSFDIQWAQASCRSGFGGSAKQNFVSILCKGAPVCDALFVTCANFCSKVSRLIISWRNLLWTFEYITDGKLRARIGPLLCFPNTGARMEREREWERVRTAHRQHKQLSQPRLGSQISDPLPGICQKYFQHARLKSKGLLMPGGTVK